MYCKLHPLIYILVGNLSSLLGNHNKSILVGKVSKWNYPVSSTKCYTISS